MRYQDTKTARSAQAASENYRTPSVPDGVVAGKPWTLPETAAAFGIPLHTLYQLAKGAPYNGVPIIKFSARCFRVNPQRFAAWLEQEAAGPVLTGKYAGDEDR